MTLEITENKVLDRELCEIAIKINKITRKSRIQLGELFQAAYDKLAGDNQYNGGYTQWIGGYGFNKMTALRYRIRWNMYKGRKNIQAKELIESLPQKDIEVIESHPEKEAILAQLDGNPSNFTLSIEEKKVENPNDNILIPVEFANEYKDFTKKVKKIDLTKLKETDIDKIHKLIERFNKIIGE